MSSSVNASTDHGDISLSAASITGEIMMNNGNGNISILSFQKGKALTLICRVKEVSVDGMQNFNGSKSKDLVKGSTNGGGIKVSAKTDREARVTFR